MNDDAVRRSLLMLRRDAIERGFLEAAIVYGLSAIRLSLADLETKIRLLNSFKK